ncbi:MAG: hypothetical protein R3C28_19400 [Pirellulaceae bacterium]
MEQLYLEKWENVPQGKGFTLPGRQILHCTFGSVLTDPTLGAELKATLNEHLIPTPPYWPIISLDT